VHWRILQAPMPARLEQSYGKYFYETSA